MKRVLAMLCAAVVVATTIPLALARESQLVKLDVPTIVRSVNRSGPTALAMVLAFYGADSLHWSRVETALASHAGEVTPQALAQVSGRLGYPARIAEPGVDSLAVLLRAGVPPIVCLQRHNDAGPQNRYLVVTTWDSVADRYVVLDGGRRPRPIPVPVLEASWNAAGRQALIVTRRQR